MLTRSQAQEQSEGGAGTCGTAEIEQGLSLGVGEGLAEKGRAVQGKSGVWVKVMGQWERCSVVGFPIESSTAGKGRGGTREGGRSSRRPGAEKG